VTPPTAVLHVHTERGTRAVRIPAGEPTSVALGAETNAEIRFEPPHVLVEAEGAKSTRLAVGDELPTPHARIRFERIQGEVPPTEQPETPTGDTRPASDTSSLPPGTEIGSYRVVRPLGQGGFATVYEVENPTLERRFALKLFHDSAARSAKEVEEARLIASLYHPHVISVVDFDDSPHGQYLVTELMSGGTLLEALRATGPLPWSRVQPIAAGLLRALGYLAEQGLVHGDIKPANILLDAFGNAKLGDFGLAGTRHRGGTAAYLAPEALTRRQNDHRSDLYSLGATLFTALTGHPPVRGTKTEIRARHAAGERPDIEHALTDRSPPVRRFLVELLAFEPDTRPADALRALHALPAQDAEPDEPNEVAPRRRRRRVSAGSPARNKVARATRRRPSRPPTEAELITRAMIALLVVAAAAIVYMLSQR
jgi:serine/threonine protein kinase